MTVRHSKLVQRVITALQNDPRSGGAAIDVVDENGTITLTGTVAADNVRQAAEDAAQRQEGVIQVINELEVEESGREGEESTFVLPAHGANHSLMGARPEVLN